jgi:hypothetical protein
MMKNWLNRMDLIKLIEILIGLLSETLHVVLANSFASSLSILFMNI